MTNHREMIVRMTGSIGRGLLLAGALALMAGCAKETVEIIPVEVPPPPPPPAMPEPPRGAAEGLAIPVPLADGSFPSPNRGLSEAATVWHLRAGLNVAALQCGGASSDQYNAMLKTHEAAFATAHEALKARYREGGGDWQDRFDDAMTRLYNHFAQPPAVQGFCEAARPVLAEAATVAPSGLSAFAAGALTAIDKPFTDFWREYHDYRLALAVWRADQPGAAPAVAVGAAAPAGAGGVRFAPSAPIVQAVPAGGD